MLKYAEGDFKVKGVELHYYRTGGDKPPIILLHGATDNGLCWTTATEVLAEKYDVVMLDAQGHGLSDKLTPGTTFETFPHQVAALTKELKLKNPVIMGHSMGADTAANVAVMFPGLPKAIILEDPPWALPEPDPEKAAEEDKNFEMGTKWLAGLRNLKLEDIAQESRKLDPQWPEAERLPWAKAKQQFDASLFKYSIINEHPYTETVPKIKCPTLLIIAEHGAVSQKDAENAAKIWKSKAPFKWVKIMGATHNIRRDNFPDYKNAVSSFLKALPV
jgi:pimeloyl-ACP methyl ester carboxylesterase